MITKAFLVLFLLGGVTWACIGISAWSGIAWFLLKCGISEWVAGPVAVLVGALVATRGMIYLSSPLAEEETQ